MTVRLTDTYVHKLPFAGKGTRYEIRDSQQTGLMLRVGARRKVFYWDTTQNSKHIKVQLGLFNHTTVEDVRFSMHALRRTFISIAAKQLGNPLLVKALVNHIATGDVTVRNYVRFELDDLRAGMRMIESFVLSHADLPSMISPLEIQA